MNPIFAQALSYFTILMMAILLFSLTQRGFFFPFLRVKLSFGRLVLVKIRAVNRDYYKPGRIEEGFLVYKGSTGEKRLSIPDPSAFYRSLQCNFVDVDEEKNAICKPNYEIITGFDAEKYNSLYLRALYKPSIMDNKEKIMIGMLIAILLFQVLLAYFIYKTNGNMEGLTASIQSIKLATITPGGL